MPRTQSAGTLLYRRGDEGLEVLIVHASGAYNRHRPWSIPKGVIDAGEEPEATARRETREETGVDYHGPLIPLGSISYKKSRKDIACFCGEAPNAKPHCASWEVDRAEFVPLDAARELLHPDQRPFIERLLAELGT